MKLRSALLLLVPSFLLAAVAVAWPERSKGEMSVSEAPAAVQAAIRRLTPAEAVTRLEKTTRDGITAYEVVFTRDGARVGAKLAAAGDVMETEETIAASQLPEGVRAAIAKKYPGAEIGKAERITLFYYDVELKVDGKERELEVFASGLVDKDEVEDDDAEDDDGEDDDDEDEDEDDDDDEDDD